MKNEPVAFVTGVRQFDPVMADTVLKVGTPLYTHPAKTEDEPNWKEMYWEMHELNHKHWSELKAHPIKDLTDEEILEIAISCHGDVQGLIDFARAILRKAQENPLQDKLDAIANKVVFGKAQEK